MSAVERGQKGVRSHKRHSWSVATHLTGARLRFGSARFAEQVRDIDGASNVKPLRNPVPRHGRFASKPPGQGRLVRMALENGVETAKYAKHANEEED